MDPKKQRQLKSKGWQIGSVADFLELSRQEVAYIELKLALSRSLRDYRKQRKLTQVELAALVESSQSRVAKMEAGDPSVSIDLLVKSLFALGMTPNRLAQIIASP